MRDKNKQSSQSGVVNILALLGVLAVMAMIPVTTKLVERSQEARTYAALEDGCQDRCHWQGGGENWDCGGNWNSCCCKLASNKSICGGCGGGGGGGGNGPADGGGDDCEKDVTGACNRACCACGSNPDGKICDVPNGYCQSGCSSRGTDAKKVKQCVGNSCVWQICNKSDPNCVSNCSSHADCRDGDVDEPEPSPKPVVSPSPPSGGKCGPNGETCNDEDKCDIKGGCNPACCAYNSQCVNGKICDKPNGYCVSGYSNRSCQAPAPLPPSVNPCEGIDDGLVKDGDRCVQCLNGRSVANSEGQCSGVEECQGRSNGTILKVGEYCFECRDKAALGVECPADNPCVGLDWGYVRSGNKCAYCYYRKVDEWVKKEDCEVSFRCQNRPDGYIIRSDNKCFRCQDGKAEISYECGIPAPPPGIPPLVVRQCESGPEGILTKVDGDCYVCRDKRAVKVECPVPTSTPTPPPGIPPLVVRQCESGPGGIQTKFGEDCYVCRDKRAVKVECPTDNPPIEEKPVAPPPSPPGGSGQYCAYGRGICTLGSPQQCEKCPSGERCDGFPNFAHCVKDNSKLEGTVIGSKIANGTITLVDASGKTYLSRTDQEGNFSLDAPTNQDYAVKISAPGYKLLAFNWNPIDGSDYLTKIKLERTDTEKEGNFEIKEDTREVLLIGWNLISLSTNLTEPLLASGLLEEINRQGGLAIAISRWQDSRWETFLSGVDKNDFPIELGRAYFVENLQESRFELEGEEITQSLPLELKPGWNAVGLPKMTNCPDQNCSARSLLNLVDEAKSNSAKAFSHFESGLWETVAKENEDFFGYDFSVRSGRGYLLKVSQPLKFLP